MEYSAYPEAKGGKAPYTWKISRLPSALTAKVTGLINGKPEVEGSFKIMAQVTDSSTGPQTATATLSLVVNPALLVITTASLAAAQVGVAYNDQLAASGGVAPYTWSATGLPSGLTCSAAGLISGTPSAVGTDSVVVTVTDSA